MANSESDSLIAAHHPGYSALSDSPVATRNEAVERSPPFKGKNLALSLFLDSVPGSCTSISSKLANLMHSHGSHSHCLLYPPKLHSNHLSADRRSSRSRRALSCRFLLDVSLRYGRVILFSYSFFGSHSTSRMVRGPRRNYSARYPRVPVLHRRR